MYTILRRSVFWRILLPFILGITVQFYWRKPFLIGPGMVLLLSLFILSFIFLFLKNYSIRWLFGLFISCFTFFSGFILVSCSLNDCQWEVTDEHNYTILLLEDPVPKSKSWMCKARIIGCDDDIFHQAMEKRVILYFPLDSETESLKAGDGILINAVLRKPDQNKNAVFNYIDYLKKQGIAAVGYVRKNSWERQEISIGLMDYIKFEGLQSQNYITKIIREIVPDKKNASIAAALFVGYKANL